MAKIEADGWYPWPARYPCAFSFPGSSLRNANRNSSDGETVFQKWISLRWDVEPCSYSGVSMKIDDEWNHESIDEPDEVFATVEMVFDQNYQSAPRCCGTNPHSCVAISVNPLHQDM